MCAPEREAGHDLRAHLLLLHVGVHALHLSLGCGAAGPLLRGGCCRHFLLPQLLHVLLLLVRMHHLLLLHLLCLRERGRFRPTELH